MKVLVLLTVALLAMAVKSTAASNSLGDDVVQLLRTNEVANLHLKISETNVLRFSLSPVTVMSPALEQRFPQIRTWRGVSLEKPEISVRCDESPAGVNVQLFTPEGTLYYSTSDDSPADEGLRRASTTADFTCLTKESNSPENIHRGNEQQSASASGLNHLHSFRLAITASGEYTQFHGGNVASVMAAIVTVVNRINGIYERELGVRLILVEGIEQLIFTNKDTDPFTDNNPTVQAVQQAQATFDLLLGTTNYDVGMLFNTGTYGLAYFGSVCDPQKKGSACMGLPAPIGESFAIYAAHEMAHQFGANHSFNSGEGPCSPNRHAAAAVEPGTGSTLLSYAGLPCGSDSLQPLMSDYFHAKSLAEVRSFLSRASCGVPIESDNHFPEISAPSTVLVPRGTPFRLDASGSDPDGDQLFWTWDQMDVGPAQTLNSPDNGLSPLFRSWAPQSNSFRTFPKWSALLQNTNSPGEKLPTTNRMLTFRVTARDSRNEGSMAWADTQVQVIGSAGPFKITSHNNGGTFRAEQTVTWDVAGTSNSPIDADHVHILLSTNGGQDFSIVLATNAANDGSETVMLPSIVTSSARLLIQPAELAFFDINDQPFAIGGAPNFTVIQSTNSQMRLRWGVVPGRSYVLQSCEDMPPTWQDIAVSTTLHGNEMEAIIPANAPARRFFRVREF